MTKEEELVSVGWEKKFVSMEPRLTEMAELYESLGFEVLLEPLPSKEEIADAACCGGQSCTACFDIDRERYRTIFIRLRT
ncbi:MAG: hypothetical protein LBQ00_03105 [Syntrophobacterales bacterium]|jgi:hypothetical protein|nr:hypothetical protein [Syntrophobacterales bacterium]